MSTDGYFMESEEEAKRLDLKTDPKVVDRHARWAGLQPGMRVADLGCGSGKTTFCLSKITGIEGETVGVDNARQRIEFAKKHYSSKRIDYILADIRSDLSFLGKFDFVWIRFVMEYYGSIAYEIVKNIHKILNPGGILCLIDLDYNCLTHYGLPKRLESAIQGIKQTLEKKADFDPYAGRKLYSYLYDMEYEDIDLALEAHHLIFGELNEVDTFNWTKKVEVGGKLSGYSFDDYEGGYEEFFEEFKKIFSHPRRFTYTPIILCRGKKPN
jgi:ubiquinone/menaquinone biosynthesis C-methylase UbiE